MDAMTFYWKPDHIYNTGHVSIDARLVLNVLDELLHVRLLDRAIQYERLRRAIPASKVDAVASLGPLERSLRERVHRLFQAAAEILGSLSPECTPDSELVEALKNAGFNSFFWHKIPP